MKIQFKIKRRQLLIWQNCIDQVTSDQTFNSGTLTKLYIANLKDLIRELNKAAIVVKDKYTLNLPLAPCLAFLFTVETVIMDVSDTDRVTIEELAGIIDQKTK